MAPLLSVVTSAYKRKSPPLRVARPPRRPRSLEMLNYPFMGLKYMVYLMMCDRMMFK